MLTLTLLKILETIQETPTNCWIILIHKAESKSKAVINTM